MNGDGIIALRGVSFILASHLQLRLPVNRAMWPRRIPFGACFAMFCLTAFSIHAADDDSSLISTQAARQILTQYCFDCHADGSSEGQFAIDELLAESDSEEVRRRWWKVLKNVRAEMMPPKSVEKMQPAVREQLLHWMQRSTLHLDQNNPDPGQVTLRRLNRTEYRNTIRDLMGIEFASEVEFPPDDTGHGFDTVADAMSVSPLLMEKYLLAAEQIVMEAVPLQHRVPQRVVVAGKAMTAAQGKQSAASNSFYSPIDVSAKFTVEHAAEYDLELDWEVDGSFDFDPGRCRVTLQLDGQDLWTQELAWSADKRSTDRFLRALPAGEHQIRFQLEPLVDKSKKSADIRFEIHEFRVTGPTDKSLWTMPVGYDRFFARSEPPLAQLEREQYAREVLEKFATRAFRRPVDLPTLDRVTLIAVDGFTRRGQSFERGIARAMAAILASPRFLFRIEEAAAYETLPDFPLIDEFALASRISYFLWSTMPDERLIALARSGRLRQELPAEVARMLADDRFRETSQNFVGQWLQTRDVETISIDPLEATASREEYDQLREQLKLHFGDDRSQYDRNDHPSEIQRLLERYRELRNLRGILDGNLRRDLRRETEALFYYIASQDRSLLELINARYSFLNQGLAKYYGLESLEGEQLRYVELPDSSPRGGVLTQGSFLIVTSNPTRTSPVKRGLFILDNLLGTPAPPPPAAVPELEQAAAAFSGRQPTLRELLELHRQDAMCASCHDRFDPLGLALENFNALGMWRSEEAGLPVDAKGELITGEAFSNLSELKQILASERRADFYTCFTEKLMTYALGRGPEYHDEIAIEQTVKDLEASGGRFSIAVLGVIQSPAFQRMRAKQ